MGVRVICRDVRSQPCPERDYLQVSTQISPDDDTVTLATIQRFVDRGGNVDATGTTWRVRTLVARQPMSPDDAMRFATRYAERKQIPLVVTDEN